jgi:flagellar P-ring protein precursor FlgI
MMWILACAAMVAMGSSNAVEGVRLKDLGRIDGVRDNMVVGYGIVTGLAGTGDSSRSQATLQTIMNALQSFGVNVTTSQLSTRNVAGVMVIATLPAYARPGDKLAVGGYKYELNGNSVQRNHPTAGTISEGATVEKNVAARIVKEDGRIDLLLADPDYTTASRVAAAINANLQTPVARAVDAGRVAIEIPPGQLDRVVDFVARVESTIVQPDQRARVVVNERTGTVVSGGDVRISAVSVAHGNLRVSILTDYLVSQPNGGFVNPSSQISTQVVPQTRVDVNEDSVNVVSLPPDTRVAELVEALNKIKTNTRDVIAVLQSIKAAGALHAELILQ